LLCCWRNRLAGGSLGVCDSWLWFHRKEGLNTKDLPISRGLWQYKTNLLCSSFQCNAITLCITEGITIYIFILPRLSLPVTLPSALHAPVSSTSVSLAARRSSSNCSSSSMQTSYRLPNPLPPLPVRKGVRGRRPKSQTIALLKAAAEAAAAAAVNGASQSTARTSAEVQLAPRPHKKRGPKPKIKVRCHKSCNLFCCGPATLSFCVYKYYGRREWQ